MLIAYQDGARQFVIDALGPLAAVAAANHQPIRAATLWSSTIAFKPSIDLSVHDAQLETARSQLGERALAAAETAGRAMSFD